eukprot:CAMPEP_0196219976 /NCGR_PEP_ID=MMETSP0912-20130531/39848_1 /TAXON_ID=49265 /ORGANISM="Thalassiosira rotula, Strain GSO102" /LENGTH=86 /DNA_ID=CAMNT_0041498103 /DNA_START=40 /DNA_END=300 /DNA_ORIENTATION=+
MKGRADPGLDTPRPTSLSTEESTTAKATTAAEVPSATESREHPCPIESAMAATEISCRDPPWKGDRPSRINTDIFTEKTRVIMERM